MDSMAKPGIHSVLKPMNDKTNVDNVANEYLTFYDPKKTESQLESERRSNSKAIALKYYDLVTDFFEYGWGESFHFATINKGESREHAFAKHEYRLALKLSLAKGEEVLDIGCGVGGPARHIAAFSEAKVVGLNCNDYQIRRCKELTKKAALDHLCRFEMGDFNATRFPSESFSKVYAIEATCHAADLAVVYSEVARLLKPGGTFAFYEWIMTDKFDPNNHHHKSIKNDILEGDALPDVVNVDKVHSSLKAAGLEVLEAEDLALTSPVPWWTVLTPRWTLSDLKITPLGRWMTHLMLIGMESTGLAPKGSCKVHRMLCKGADALALGGKEGIFSPMYMVIARKPPHKK